MEPNLVGTETGLAGWGAPITSMAEAPRWPPWGCLGPMKKAQPRGGGGGDKHPRGWALSLRPPSTVGMGAAIG